MGAPLADATGQDFHHTSNDDAEMPDWDDDDLVAMQAEPMVHPVLPHLMLTQMLLHCPQIKAFWKMLQVSVTDAGSTDCTATTLCHMHSLSLQHVCSLKQGYN